MSECTPGKWEVMSGREYYDIFGMSGPAPKYCIVSFEDDGTEPWTIAEITGGLDHGQEDANARLIAAAPLMYEALQDMVRLGRGSQSAGGRGTGRPRRRRCHR